MDEERLIWLKGEILPVGEAKINVLSPTSQFGANVFEGIRCYKNDDDNCLYAFRLHDHYKRLFNSIKLFRIENRYTEENMEKAFMDVILANNYNEDLAVRQTVFVDGFGSWFSKETEEMFVAPIKKSRISDIDKCTITCEVSSWQRISDRNVSPRIKVGANYINSRMAVLEAKQNGYDSAIFLNDKGQVCEGPGACLFIVRDNELITAPLSESVLESITRDTIINIAKDNELVIKERNIDRTELYIADEVFMCGSAVEVTPVVNVDGYQVGEGITGHITRKLHNDYINIVTGKNKKYIKWLTKVEK